MVPAPETAEELFRLPQLTADTPPGTRVAYSNLGVGLLATVLAEIAGQPFPEYMTENVFRPLGMETAGFALTDAIAERLAPGYIKVAVAEDGDIEVTPAPAQGHWGPMAGAGGLMASTLDPARFAALQFRDGPAGGDQILAGGTLHEMWRPVARGRAGVGAGWFSAPFAGETMIMHNGGIVGYRSDLRLIPALKLGVAVLMNMSPQAVRGRNSAAGPAAIESMILNALLPIIKDEGMPDAGQP